MRSILCLDIGSGTQDVLYYQPRTALENCPKFILPSPAVAVSKEIEGHTRKGNNIFLFGQNMGGGFSGALRAHLEAGLRVVATSRAALALSDDPDRVTGLGVQISDNCPPGFVPVYLADFDPGFWRSWLAAAGLEYPELILACAQDHGYHPRESNRRGRFELWERFLTASRGEMSELLFAAPPVEMTRLKALAESIGAGLVADSGSAAALGALFDPAVEGRVLKEGGCIVNIGNSHTVAFLVYADRVWGVYEQHTGILTPEKLRTDLDLFRKGRLKNEEVFFERGHGCYTADLPQAAAGFAHTFVLGPKRDLLQGSDIRYPCPGGDMMLAGCFGLLKGYFKQQGTGNG
ncbi:MAG: DUF1786 domain-containing protein [Desulfonatronovibrionaceae bacterium]